MCVIIVLQLIRFFFFLKEIQVDRSDFSLYSMLESNCYVKGYR